MLIYRRALAVALVLLSLVVLGGWIHGLPVVVVCNMNGVFDLTKTCNDIYYLTGLL